MQNGVWKIISQTKNRKMSRPKKTRLPSLRVTPFPSLLPMMSRVVFVDWHGVLSNDNFWSSILETRRHPYRKRLEAESQKLFLDRSDLIRAWMRGELQSLDIINALDVRLKRGTRSDYLLRRLYSDCRKMRVNQELLTELQKVRTTSFVVIATDNMDCFFSGIDSIPEIRSTVDGILCSSNIGVLKRENVRRFFGPWLQHHRLSFAQALLLDDSAANCEAFRSAGGAAYRVTSAIATLKTLRKWHNNSRF